MKNAPPLPTIFVQIASYRDAECQWTIRDLFARAAHPERIFVGLCWQLGPEDEISCFEEPYARPDQVREMRFSIAESKGVCWARAQAQSLYQDEDYVLMIDSHMRFVEGWDEAMIGELKGCDSDKPILSAYPPGYTPPDNLATDPRLTVMCLNPANVQGDIRGRGEVLDRAPDKPLRGAFIAAGFLFARGELVSEVPYDPHMYFNQEEVSLAARFFTHGWDVFHPSRILLYHYYNAPKPKEAAVTHHQHWNDHKDWQQRQVLARRRLHFITGYRSEAHAEAIVELDKYGLGRMRGLLELALFSGLDLTRMEVAPKARTGAFIDGLHSLRDKPIADPAPPVKEKSVHPPLAPVDVGEFLPPFCLPDQDGKPRDLQLYAGRSTVLIMLPSQFPAYTQEFLESWCNHLERLKQLGAYRLFVIQGSPAEAKKLRGAYGLEELVLADADGAVAATLGADSLDSTPLTVVVDAAQRVRGRIRQRNAANHLGELIRALVAQAAMAKGTTLVTQRHAPVLMLPEAISAGLTDELLSYWQAGRKYAGSIGEGSQTRIVSGKRRSDVNIDDAALLARVDSVLAKTLLPELRRLGADICYRERYKIGCYHENDQGYYHQHRDTGVPGLAHRRYSMTLPLNDGYEGGRLVFPEYGVEYAIPARTAVAFPSALLHGVTPVTKGERYVMVSFMHGEAEEFFRRQQLLAQGEAYRRGDVEMLVQPEHGGLKLSPFYYTQKGGGLP